MNKIGIVVSRFNEDITSVMKDKALEISKESDLEVVEVIEVPGAFEIPFAVQELLEKNVDGVATLGAVIKGKTDHDEVIMNSIGKKLIDLSLKYKKPVTLGVIGPKATREQVEDRKVEYTKRSIESLAYMLSRKSNGLNQPFFSKKD
tara:strand:- start:244 stop:684 length:441 start_codon:yes stop_codon:yes gene_type:complete